MLLFFFILIDEYNFVCTYYRYLLSLLITCSLRCYRNRPFTNAIWEPEFHKNWKILQIKLIFQVWRYCQIKYYGRTNRYFLSYHRNLFLCDMKALLLLRVFFALGIINLSQLFLCVPIWECFIHTKMCRSLKVDSLES